jgi:hypothetical protein
MMSKHTYVPKHSGAQAHLHEDGSSERDWIFGEVELGLLIVVQQVFRKDLLVILPVHSLSRRQT